MINMLKINVKIACFLLMVLTSYTHGMAQQPKQLNILLFTADDLDRNSLGCYGAKVPDISPHIDRFASQSLNFEKGFVNSAICAPSRGILASGLYPHNSGVNGFKKMSAENSHQLLMEVLRDHGYSLGILGKVGHSTPKEGFEWDYAYDQADLGDGRSPSLYYERTKRFLKDRKGDGKPFYFMVNSHDPHRPYHEPSKPLTKGAEAPSRIYSPEEIEVPGFVPDLPGVREELSYYFNSTKRLDDTFGKVMQALQESGFGENTIVVFISDNGIAIPFAKANTYEASNRTPLLVRFPGVTNAGDINREHLVSTIDLYPTLLDALHIDVKQQLDGKSFLPLLAGRNHNSEWIFSEIDYKAGGGPTPMRSAYDGRYLYIYNAWSDGERRYANNNEGLTMKAMDAAAVSDKGVADRVKHYRYREPEELYDLQSDPDALHNLIRDAGSKDKLAELQSGMASWMDRTTDPLLSVFKVRDNKQEALKLFYQIYPEAIEQDKDKETYSQGRGWARRR